MENSPNTIVTIGDRNYLWGIFLLVASARKAGMTEPFLIGTKNFTEADHRILEQLGNVSFVSLDKERRSLTCCKPFVMLQAKTEFVTWADSDAFFTGNVSALLLPEQPAQIHFRLRSPKEMATGRKETFVLQENCMIPPTLLEAWRKDLQKIAGNTCQEPRNKTTGSGCFCALSLERHRHFLEVWKQLVEEVLPERDCGVVDNTLLNYPQLDESTLNACLNFLPDAPIVQKVFQMDKNPARLFVHFIAHPKPWQGWTKRAFRHFDSYVAVVAWAVSQGFELPTPVPFCLKSSNKWLLRLLIPWMTLKGKLRHRLRYFNLPGR